jgi:hypothetical protein
MLVALAHTHPGLPHDLTFGDCQGDNGNGTTSHVKWYPGGTGPQGRIGNDYSQGGGSPYDWQFAQNFGGTGIDVYTMNKAGEIWKLPKGWNMNQFRQDRGGRKKMWKSSSCVWP